ncbi:MAG: IniB N-terminal domain-containing protein [Microbacterium sp.]
MSTPVATVADALISFILSLLRDPAAVEEFDAAPKAVLASKGLADACAADVQAVKPVIVDNPTVVVKPVMASSAPPPPPPSHHESDEVTREIQRIVQQFTTTIDARTTIVDQSTNQNIWTNGGDVTQIFDQEAVVASGDDAMAVGDDATFVDSEVDVTVGDVSIGNTTTEGSFNNSDVETVLVTEETVVVLTDPAVAEATDPAAIAGAAVETAVDATLDATVTAQATVQESIAPAEDPLATDLTASDPYESSDSGAAIVEEAYVEEPAEEQ